MLMEFKDIGDNLTLSEYNAIVSLLRNNCPFSEQIKINNKKVTGEYGEYVFDLESTTILDTGILVSNETMSSIGTVKLENPVFPHSEYIIKFNVYSIEDYNVFDGDTDGIIVTPLEITLENNVAVNIPFETLDLNNIIGFDAEIQINHIGISESHYYELTTSTPKLDVGTGEEFEITAHLSDLVSSENLNNETIHFYVDNEFIGTSKTNNDGIATLKTSINELGEHTIHTKHYYTQSNSITVNVKKYTEINLISNENIVGRNESATLSAQLLVNDVPAHISDVSVTFEVYDSFAPSLMYSEVVLTDSDGVASFDYVGTGVTDVNIIARADNITSNWINIEDCIFYDKCTSQNNKWEFNDLNVSYTENGMKLSPNLQVGSMGYANMDLREDGASFNIDFEVNEIIGSNFIFDLSSGSILFENVSIGSYHVEIHNADYKIFKDGVLISEQSFSEPISHIMPSFELHRGNEITFKNIKVKYLKAIDLTSSASILSYNDGDSAILTASLSTMQTGQIVELYDGDDNLIGVMTDNDDGTYGYVYQSQGAGDIGFYAKWGMILSETYGIYDYNWAGTNVSVSHNGSEITVSNTARGIQSCYLNELDGREPSFILEFDSYASNTVSDGEQILFAMKSASNNYVTGIGTNQSTEILWWNYTTSYSYERVSGANWKNKWLHYKYTIGNGEFKFELFENDNLLYSRTLNLNNALLTANDLVYWFYLPYQPSSRLVKNIKLTEI